jgi:hypothetical protein
MRLRLAKSYVVGWIYPRRGAAGCFKIFKCSFDFLKVNRNAALQKKRWKLPQLGGKCFSGLLDSLKLLVKGYRKAAEKCPKGCWKASGQFLKGIRKLLYWEMSKYPLSANRRGVRIAQRLLAKTWQQFLFIE